MSKGLDRWAWSGGWLYAAFLFVVATTNAQTPPTPISTSVDRAQLLRNQQPTTRDETLAEGEGADNDQAAASPNDPDLGEQAILKRADQYKPFSIIVGAPISYTSNVALVPNNAEGDGIFTPNVAFIYAPRITKTLYANVVLAQQEFYYFRFPDLDFGSFDARAGLVYALPQAHNLLLRLDYAFNRLTESNSFDGFYTSHSIIFGGEMPFRFGRAQQISIGADLNLLLDSNPEAPGRNEYGAFVAYAINFTRKFSASGLARLAVRDYTDVDRTDVSGIFILSANYQFNRWFGLSATTSFATNNSNRDAFDYDVFNIGGALTASFRF